MCFQVWGVSPPRASGPEMAGGLCLQSSLMSTLPPAPPSAPPPPVSPSLTGTAICPTAQPKPGLLPPLPCHHSSSVNKPCGPSTRHDPSNPISTVPLSCPCYHHLPCGPRLSLILIWSPGPFTVAARVSLRKHEAGVTHLGMCQRLSLLRIKSKLSSVASGPS